MSCLEVLGGGCKMLPHWIYISKSQILLHTRFFSIRIWIASPKSWKRRLKRIRGC